MPLTVDSLRSTILLLNLSDFLLTEKSCYLPQSLPAFVLVHANSHAFDDTFHVDFFFLCCHDVFQYKCLFLRTQLVSAKASIKKCLCQFRNPFIGHLSKRSFNSDVSLP